MLRFGSPFGLPDLPMADILYITCGMSSSLHSSFELSRRLTAAGHRVRYLSPAEVGDAVRAQGYEFRRLAGDLEIERELAPARSVWRRGMLRAPVEAWKWLAERRRLRRRSIANDEIERTVRELRPDALIVDIEMHYATIATAGLGIPTLLAMVWFTIFRRPELPPLHSSSRPGTSWLSRAGNRLAWSRSYAAMLAQEWRRRLSPGGLRGLVSPVRYDTLWIGDLKAVARSRGFDLAAETSRTQWLRPFAYTRLPILCMNAAEMDFPNAQPKNLHYVGPMVDLNRREVRMTSQERERFERLRQQRKTDGGRPLVYCSLGTFWATDKRFLRAVVSVFARRPEWDLILGLGGKLQPSELGAAPPNALLLTWAPQLEALEIADCAIVHGGIGSINECVALGVPMVIYSTKHVDQNGCAARVEHHGLGLRGDKDRDTSEEIERKIEAVLAGPYRTAVAAMRGAFDAYLQANGAVALLERSLRRTVDISE